MEMQWPRHIHMYPCTTQASKALVFLTMQGCRTSSMQAAKSISAQNQRSISQHSLALSMPRVVPSAESCSPRPWPCRASPGLFAPLHCTLTHDRQSFMHARSTGQGSLWATRYPGCSIAAAGVQYQGDRLKVQGRCETVQGCQTGPAAYSMGARAILVSQ